MQAYETQCQNLKMKIKIKVFVEGTDTLSIEQFEYLAKQQVTREVADFVRDISGQQLETHTPTAEEEVLWKQVLATKILKFNITDCLASKGERGELTVEGMTARLAKKADADNMTDEQVLEMLRKFRTTKKAAPPETPTEPPTETTKKLKK